MQTDDMPMAGENVSTNTELFYSKITLTYATVKEANTAYLTAYFRRDIPSLATALRDWMLLSAMAIQEAATFEQAVRAWRKGPNEPLVEYVALERCLELASNVEEITLFVDMLDVIPHVDELREGALQKQRVLVEAT